MLSSMCLSIQKVSLRRGVQQLLHSRKNSTKMGKLSDKVAIVTASTNGIGFAIAQKLASEGARVVVSSRNEVNVNTAIHNLKNSGYQNVTGIVCHVAEKTDRQKLFEKAITHFGGIDILVSNAAVNPVFGVPISECPEGAWDKIFEINVKSYFLLTKEVLPHLKQRKNSSIIYISSLAGLQPFKELGPYGVSKTALLGLTKAFALELGPSNIRVNCIAPGIVKTNFGRVIYENDAIPEVSPAQIPLRRIGEPDDIGGVAAFLCSDDAKYISGETIAVAGGVKSRL